MNKPKFVTEYIYFAGLIFKGLRAADLYPQAGAFKFIVTVNADLIVISFQRNRFANLISNNFATIDGQITYWLARILGKPRKVNFEKISGSSFAYSLLQYASDNKLRVFFLGASSTVNELAVLKARNQFGVDVMGYSPPISPYPFSLDWNEETYNRIKDHSPHILLVAFGSPKQEFWIEDSAETLKHAGVQLAIGCGGTLDFLAGSIPRAPVIIQKIGLESLYRLAMQPSWFRVKRIAKSLLIFPIVFWKHFF
jgi:N-acetylglucosaminyldiphosphoundecaprenol N-acetyl-beta-D-mannosaminyltransferase